MGFFSEEQMVFFGRKPITECRKGEEYGNISDSGRKSS